MSSDVFGHLWMFVHAHSLCRSGGRVGHMDQNHENQPVFAGMREIWGKQQPFGFDESDRRHHLYCIGKTGTGKSTLLFNLLVQDIYAGRGICLIDPHGDLAEELMDCIPSWRTDDVVYFNPADLEYPIGFNLLQNVHPDDRHRVASGLLRCFKAIWHESWGSRLEYILYAALAALLDCENASILGLPRLLADPRYRRWVIGQIKDPVVRSFWVDEYERYDERFRREAIAPIQNKVGKLLMSPPLRNILGQVKRKIDPRFMMDHGRLFIANLSKGSLGHDKASLLGSFLVTSFELAAMSRVDMPESKRPDFHLYIDEFHNFTTESFASILSEARKYHLSLTLSHQYLSQVQENIHDAIFGNAGTIVSFRVGENDAKILASEFGDGYTPSRFSSLGNYEAIVKHLSGGHHGEPFVGRMMPPLEVQSGRRDIVLRRSREKYATRRQTVEDNIRRFMRPRSRL